MSFAVGWKESFCLSCFLHLSVEAIRKEYFREFWQLISRHLLTCLPSAGVPSSFCTGWRIQCREGWEQSQPHQEQLSLVYLIRQVSDTNYERKNGWGVLALIVPTGRHSQEYTPSYLWRDIWWDLISKRDMKRKRRYYLKPVLHSLNSSARHLDHWIIIWRFHGQAHRFIDNLLTFGCLMVMPPAHWLSFGCLMVKGHWFINNLLTFRRLMVKAHCLIDNGPTFGLLVFTCTSRMRSPTPCYTGPGIGPDHLGPCTWIQLS